IFLVILLVFFAEDLIKNTFLLFRLFFNSGWFFLFCHGIFLWLFGLFIRIVREQGRFRADVLLGILHIILLCSHPHIFARRNRIGVGIVCYIQGGIRTYRIVA